VARKVGDAIVRLRLTLFACGVVFTSARGCADSRAGSGSGFRAWTGTAEDRGASLTLMRRSVTTSGLLGASLHRGSQAPASIHARVLRSRCANVNAVELALRVVRMLRVIARSAPSSRSRSAISQPVLASAQAADRVASDSTRRSPRSWGQSDHVGLGGIERNARQTLRRTIDERRRSARRGSRSTIPRRAPKKGAAGALATDLKQWQAAIQGERMASIGDSSPASPESTTNRSTPSPAPRVPARQSPRACATHDRFAAYREGRGRSAPRGARRAGHLRLDVRRPRSRTSPASPRSAAPRAQRANRAKHLRNFSRVSGEAVAGGSPHFGMGRALSPRACLLWQHLSGSCASSRGYRRWSAARRRIDQIRFMNLLVNAPGRGAGQRAGPDRDFRPGSTGILRWYDHRRQRSPACRIRSSSASSTRSSPPNPRTGTGLGLSISTDVARRHGDHSAWSARRMAGSAVSHAEFPLRAGLPRARLRPRPLDTH
jgi:hypothetical protein